MSAKSSHDSAPPLVRLAPWIVAACCALLAVVFALLAFSARSEAESLRTTRDIAETSSKLAQLQLSERTLLAEKIIADLRTRSTDSADLARLRVLTLTSPLANLPVTRATLVWDRERGRALLHATKLPVVAESMEYRLRLAVTSGAATTVCAVFRPDADGTARVTFNFAPASDRFVLSVSLDSHDAGPATSVGPVVLAGP